MFSFHFILEVWLAIVSGLAMFWGMIIGIIVVAAGFSFILHKLRDQIYGAKDGIDEDKSV